MSNDNGGHDPVDRPLREAARWRVDLQDPNLSPEELLRWNEWQTSAPNREAFDSLESIWRVIHADAEDMSSVAAPNPERARLVGEEAAYWYFLCADAPNTSHLDRREFLAWLRRSPENIAELLKIAHLDGRLRKLNNADAPNPERPLSFKLPATAVGLVALAGLALGALHYLQPDQVITTGASQWGHMTLPDGTAVHVDAHSSVEVEYTKEERVVHVRAGSVVFDVAKDARPFIARTQLIDATAVGTRFGVSIDPGVTTTVSEGVVKITGRGQSDGKAVMLKAGEELRVSNSTLASAHHAQVDAKRKLQWSEGLLDLSGMTISAAAEEFNRRNRTQIIVDNPTLGARVVEVARVKVDSPETYAQAVANSWGVAISVDKENGVIRLSE